MQYIKVPPGAHQKRNFPILKHIKLTLLVLVLLGFFIFVWTIFNSPGSIFHFSFPGLPKAEERVNVLLLGNAGGKHDGSLLTDTLMVASYNYKTNQANFISLPRDLWLDSLHAKVNAVYEIGEEDDNGLKFSKETIGAMFGIPIQYAIRIDFSGFQQAIDQVGGVDVTIDKPFDDYNYPITGKEDDLCGYVEQEKEFNPDEAKALNIEAGKHKVLIAPDGKIATDSAKPEKGLEYFSCRYEHISFKAGLTNMDGATALKFVRSRMGTNGEGSDFARSRRQQKVIEAFKDKTLTLGTLVNPGKIKGLLDTFGKNFETDMPVDKMIALFSVSKKITQTNNYVLSNVGENALLVNPPLGDYGAWVLVPKDKTYKEIQLWIASILSGGGENEATNSTRTGTK